MEETLSLSTRMVSPPLITFWNRYKALSPFFVGCIFLPVCIFPFLPGYDPSKWLCLYLLSALSLFIAIPGNTFYFPSLSRAQKYLLIGLGLTLTFNYFYHDISLLGRETVDRLMFWSLFFFYYSCLKETESSEKMALFYALFLGTGLFIMMGFLNFIFIKPQLSFTFGNLNKSAEFVGFSLALQLGLLSSYSKKIQKWILVLISMSLAYLYFAKCRSAWIGVACFFAYLLWTNKIPLRTLLYISFGASALIGFFGILFIVKDTFPMQLLLKEGSITERWHILMNTLSLIQDHPLGVGLGRYGLAAAPYMKNLPHNVFNENYQLFSPYNELLRFMAEEGVIASVIMFLFMASFVVPLQKLKLISQKCPESIAFLIFFLVQSSFQYPLSQPIVLFLTPFVLAYTVHYTIELKFIRIPMFQWLKGGLGVYFGFAAMAISISIYLSTALSSDTNLSKNIYNFWKEQHLLKTILFMSYVDEDYKGVKEVALKELTREPQNLEALKYLGLANVKTGNVEQGCIELRRYNQAYAIPTTVVDEISKYCH